MTSAVAAAEHGPQRAFGRHAHLGLGPRRELVHEEPLMGVEATVVEPGEVLEGALVAPDLVGRGRVGGHDHDPRAPAPLDGGVEAAGVRGEHVAVGRVHDGDRLARHVARAAGRR